MKAEVRALEENDQTLLQCQKMLLLLSHYFHVQLLILSPVGERIHLIGRHVTNALAVAR